MLKHAPIIVGGFYRSGTSLVRRLLDSHSNIHCPPEIKWFKDFYGDYMNDELAHVRFFKTIRTLGLGEEELLRIYGRAYVEARELACAKLNKQRWADKNPENVLYLNKWHQILNGNLIFIFVVRNPLDSLASLNEVGFKKAVPAKFQEKALILKDYYRKAMAYSTEFGEDTIVVKYEELVSNPEQILRGLFSSLDEIFEPEVLHRFYTQERQFGIEDPKVKKSKEIYLSSIGRWESELTKQQIDFCQNNLSEIFERFEYD